MKKSIILSIFISLSVNLFTQEVINNKLELNNDFQFGPTVPSGDWVEGWGIVYGLATWMTTQILFIWLGITQVLMQVNYE